MATVAAPTTNRKLPAFYAQFQIGGTTWHRIWSDNLHCVSASQQIQGQLFRVFVGSRNDSCQGHTSPFPSDPGALVSEFFALIQVENQLSVIEPYGHGNRNRSAGLFQHHGAAV